VGRKRVVRLMQEEGLVARVRKRFKSTTMSDHDQPVAANLFEIWSDWLHHELLYAVPHRQYVFTVPKRLRPYFLHERKLLGELCRVAYRTLREFLRTTLGEPDVVPGVVASIQTFGSLVGWHPHLHLLVTDGAFRPDGTFLHLGYHEIEVLTEAFRRALLRQFVRSELLSEEEALSMLSWPHSGFHVHHGARIEPDDVLGLLQVARYAARAPIALERLSYDAARQQVTLDSGKREGIGNRFAARQLKNEPRRVQRARGAAGAGGRGSGRVRWGGDGRLGIGSDAPNIGVADGRARAAAPQPGRGPSQSRF
jgi:Putative transposase